MDPNVAQPVVDTAPPPTQPPIVSRYKEHRGDFLDASILKDAEKAKQLKRKEREDKQRLLAQIKEDRETKAMRSGPRLAAPPPAVRLDTAASSSTPSNHSTNATIQFRLPASLLATPSSPAILKHIFLPSDPVSSLFVHLRGAVARVPPASTAAIHLVSSFPTRVLEEGSPETQVSIRDAGLCPSASLNVLVKPLGVEPREAFVSSQTHAPVRTLNHPNTGDEMEVDEEEGDEEEDEGGDDEEHEHSEEEDQDDSEGEEEHDHDHDHDESDDDDGDHIMGGMFGHGFGRGRGARGGGVGHRLGGFGPVQPPPLQAGAIGRGGAGGMGRGGMAMGGFGPQRGGMLRGGFPMRGRGGGFGGGNRLGGEAPLHAAVQEPTHVEPGIAPAMDARALRLAAIQNRATAPPIPTQNATHSKPHRKPHSPSALLELCLPAAVALLTQHGNKRPLKHCQLMALRRLGADLAQKVLEAAIRAKKVDRAFITRLAVCPITTYTLDSYNLATDSLLETIGFTHYLSIRHISLKGCTLLTDDSIISLKPCRNLTHLDLNSCRLTDAVFQHLPTFQSLTNLSLARTKITSAGLKRFCADPRVPRLEVLNLTGCNSITSPHTLRDVSPLTKISLHTLSLQACAIERGEWTAGETREEMRELKVLDVSWVRGVTEEFLSLVSGFSGLLELDLTGSGESTVVREEEGEEVVLVQGLASGAGGVLSKGVRDLVVRSQLEVLRLPHKGDPGIDVVVRALCGSGVGVGVGAMRLRVLDLDGFGRVTDFGVVLRKGLGELYLDRVRVGDAVVEAIRELPLLEVLSLSETGVTNTGVARLNACRFKFTLKSLNVAKTVVTAEGIANGLFAFEHLVSLNIERSRVVDLEACLHALQANSTRNSKMLTDAIVSGSGVRWSVPVVEVVQEREEEDEGDDGGW
ncbi:hypothetical protein HDU98_005973 [Podochytrium sp. JEL0797]|nr:hypothetical protein HDU98_005973 [Podochytrium sp. JEL0797]